MGFGCSINRGLIAIKVLNFFAYAGFACFVPFKSVFQKQLGMTSTQNGIIQATMTIASIFSQPITGIITDKTKAYKTILVTCFLMSILSTFPMIFIPPVNKIRTTFSCYETNNSTSMKCFKQNFIMLDSCEMNQTSESNEEQLKVEYIDNINNSCQTSNLTFYCYSSEAEYGETFMLLMFLTVFLSIFMMPLNALIDSTIMDILGEKRRHMYGNQRLWGAVGFGSIALLVGYLIEVFSVPNSIDKNYMPSMIGVAVFWILSCLSCIKLKVTAQKATSIFEHLGVLLKKPVILAFLFVVFICGFSTGIHFTYFFWYLETLNGGTKTIMGLSLFVTCASEVPVFLVSGYICEKLGYVPVLSIGLIAIGIRFTAYTFVTTSWHILFVELLHGITFALPLAAMCSYAVAIAPEGLIATLITLSQAIYWGLGNMSGALIGGILYEELGGKWTFRVTAIICFSVGCVYWFTNCVTNKPLETKANNSEEHDPNDAAKENLMDKEICEKNNANEETKLTVEQSKDSSKPKVL